MGEPMTTYWSCSCGETGSYDWASAPKTDAALPEAKHMKTCGGEVNSGTSAEVLARAMARMEARA